MDRITVVGSMNTDLVVQTPRIPAMGETLLGGEFTTVPGGKGANQAVAISRLGGEAFMVGRVGDDFFGRALLSNLESNGVDAGHVKFEKGCATGIAMILVKDGDNCIVVAPGANSRINTDAIDEAEDLIKGSAMMLLQLEIPIPAAEHAMRIARKHGVKVLLNPAPAIPLGSEILQMADIITPNESECGIMAGMEVKSYDDAVTAAGKLKDAGAHTVVVTLGENGAVMLENDHVVHVPARRVHAVDTTAAGDTFTAALAVSLVRGEPLIDAVKYAVAAASITVTRFGAQSSLPTALDVSMIMDGLSSPVSMAE